MKHNKCINNIVSIIVTISVAMSFGGFVCADEVDSTDSTEECSIEVEDVVEDEEDITVDESVPTEESEIVDETEESEVIEETIESESFEDEVEEFESEIVQVEESVQFEEAYSTNGHNRDEMVIWANSMVGNGYDYDGYNGNQCVDIIYMYAVTLGQGNSSLMYGNACDFASKTLPSGWRYVYSDYQPGDIAVWRTNLSYGGDSTISTSSYGHVGIIDSCDGYGFNAVEQNAYSNGAVRSYVTKNWHKCSELQCAIRPDFSTANQWPIGCVDYCEVRNNQVYIQGWAFDPDDKGASLILHIFIDNDTTYSLAFVANHESSDVNSAYGLTGAHRFAEYFALPAGNHTVRIFALNSIRNDDNTLLGSSVGTGQRFNVTIAQTITTGWVQRSGNTYYVLSDGSYARGWKNISGSTYYFDSNGVMQTGLKTVDGFIYYFGTNGVRFSGGWKTISGNSYYFQSNGRAFADITTNIGGVDYVFNSQGICTGSLSSTVNMYRLYNPNSGEHFYTSSATERNNLIDVGWNYEGIGWVAPATSNTPVYRLYNRYGGEHHYTTSVFERNSLIAAGWEDEGIGWYSDDSQRVPLYRQYNPFAYANNHNYTTSHDENNYLVSIGWRAENIGWYGVAAGN